MLTTVLSFPFSSKRSSSNMLVRSVNMPNLAAIKLFVFCMCNAKKKLSYLKLEFSKSLQEFALTCYLMCVSRGQYDYNQSLQSRYV